MHAASYSQFSSAPKSVLLFAADGSTRLLRFCVFAISVPLTFHSFQCRKLLNRSGMLAQHPISVEI